MAENAPRIRTALGLHPELAHLRSDELDLFDELILETEYVGEIGLDGSQSNGAYWSDQVRVFAHILRSTARAGGRKLSLHSRGAAADVVRLVGKHCDPTQAILHWFTGTKDELTAAVDAGFWFSVGPAMIRSSAGQGRVTAIPRERLLLETDGPFGKHRQVPLMPWEAEISLQKISSIWRMTNDQTIEVLRSNLRQFGSSKIVE